MMPPAGMSSPYMPWAASCENSRNGAPGSISARTRSRGSSLPRARWRWRACSPPPARIFGDARREVLDLRAHRRRIGAEGLGAGIERGLDDRHGLPSTHGRRAVSHHAKRGTARQGKSAGPGGRRPGEANWPGKRAISPRSPRRTPRAPPADRRGARHRRS